MDDWLVLLPADFGADLLPMTDFGDLVIDKFGGRTICWAEVEDRPFEVEHFVPSHDSFALAEDYTQIGLWMFHLLFSGRVWAGLHLTHARGTVVALYVLVRDAKPNDTFLKLNRPAFTGGQNFRSVARYGTDTKGRFNRSSQHPRKGRGGVSHANLTSRDMVA